jgi:hypothetical protein
MDFQIYMVGNHLYDLNWGGGDLYGKLISCRNNVLWFIYEVSPKRFMGCFSMPQCSEVGLLGSDWIMRALTS